MVSKRHSFILPSVLALSLASVLALITGCGEGKAPLAPESASLDQASGGVTYLTFSPQALERAGKIASIPETGKTVSKTFYPDQTASMKIQDLNGSGTRDDLEVEFTVAAGDLSKRKTITMTVYGNNLSDLVMAFEPDGLVFNQPAKLAVKIGAQRVDQSLLDLKALLLPFADVEAYHDHDGSVEGATITSVKTYIYVLLLGEAETPPPLYDYARIKVDVPGFSRYGLSN
ncbi:MAG: hypothetical protein HYW07_10210 [Candidatus Latescibacteria bacterium]|nr:hypothetical protein [Candidatus Latescibacterota bacterium]